jgi:hypothetical protein
MSATRPMMLNEIRYAERLCQRTARFYRHIQSAGVFLSVVAGSATLSALAKTFPEWVAISGAVVFTLVGAGLICMRPADKAATNETDAKRYSALRARAATLTDEQLRAALDESRVSDTPEFEALRNVAYNDVVIEVGQPTHRMPLTVSQRLLSAFA